MGKFHTKRYYKKQAEDYKAWLNWYKISYSMLLHTLNSVYDVPSRENEKPTNYVTIDDFGQDHVMRIYENGVCVLLPIK